MKLEFIAKVKYLLVEILSTYYEKEAAACDELTHEKNGMHVKETWSELADKHRCIARDIRRYFG